MPTSLTERFTSHVHQVLEDVHHPGHLAEHQHSVARRFQSSQELVEKNHLQPPLPPTYTPYQQN